MAKERFDPERRRLLENGADWKRWGPYLSERQWGTVREDYSADGEAWDYFPHEHARSRAYRWGEDGIGGFSDSMCRLCLSVALWNGRDPFLKERLFGLTNSQANHGEDVKESYYYLDGTPTHSYLKMLYKYPQAEFPYHKLIDENGRRDKTSSELELIDTGVFDEDRYFDVFIEYARADIEDILLRITVYNRGPKPAELHVLPHVWFRNTWSFRDGIPRPRIRHEAPGLLDLEHRRLGELLYSYHGDGEDLFCENETNTPALFDHGDPGYFKDGIHRHVVRGEQNAVNPERIGSKAAVHYRAIVEPDRPFVVRARLHRPRHVRLGPQEIDAVFRSRIEEANTFYGVLQADIEDHDAKLVQRQAFAGLIWTKQFYYYDVNAWLEGDRTMPKPPLERKGGRNRDWDHLYNCDILHMPDAWEYPWYAAWDLAFHCLPFALIDTQFAKEQLVLLTREWYMHPSGQLPAYEWSFSNANPPVHAWATWRVFQIDRKLRGDEGDLEFLESVFHKLLVNFTWWVNRKDHDGNNVFQGGFLGLDNIGVFDRSEELPEGGHIDQADGTAWMAMYCLNLMRIALELALHNRVYEDIASKFFEHFLHIADAVARVGGGGLWDEEDQFFYDWLHLGENGGHPDQKLPMRIRSIVGLIPLYAVEVLEPELMEKLPRFNARLEWFLNHRPDLCRLVSHWDVPGTGKRRLLSLLRGHRMKALIRRMVDENEFLSDFGVRALSRAHLHDPFIFHHDGAQHVVRYTPAESDSHLFGGNSNWRGPVWFPVNFLLIEALQKFHHYYGDDFLVECPTRSGQMVTLLQIADEISRRLVRLFTRNEDGRRPALGHHPKFREDPHFRDHVLFYEYFHGDNGRGVGASHQTGWTALVAKLIQPRLPPH